MSRNPGWPMMMCPLNQHRLTRVVEQRQGPGLHAESASVSLHLYHRLSLRLTAALLKVGRDGFVPIDHPWGGNGKVLLRQREDT